MARVEVFEALDGLSPTEALVVLSGVHLAVLTILCEQTVERLDVDRLERALDSLGERMKQTMGGP